MGSPLSKGHNSSLGTTGRHAQNTDGHTQMLPVNTQGTLGYTHICLPFMLKFYPKTKPLPRAHFKGPRSQKATFRSLLVHAFTKRIGVRGQQEGSNGERFTAEVRKWGQLPAGRALPSSGCVQFSLTPFHPWNGPQHTDYAALQS